MKDSIKKLIKISGLIIGIGLVGFGVYTIWQFVNFISGTTLFILLAICMCWGIIRTCIRIIWVLLKLAIFIALICLLIF